MDDGEFRSRLIELCLRRQAALIVEGRGGQARLVADSMLFVAASIINLEEPVTEMIKKIREEMN